MPALGQNADIGLVIAHGVELLDDIHAIIIIDCAHRVDDVFNVLTGDVTTVRHLQALYTVLIIMKQVCNLHVVVAVYKEIQVIVLFDDHRLFLRDAPCHFYRVPVTGKPGSLVYGIFPVCPAEDIPLVPTLCVGTLIWIFECEAEDPSRKQLCNGRKNHCL